MNLKKLVHKRRGVSPILAAVLLIGLAITAGAVLFVVVIPMITAPGGGIVIDGTSEFPTNTTVKVVLRNEGSEGILITNITVTIDGTLIRCNDFFEFTVNSGSSNFETFSFTNNDATPITGFFTVTFGDDATEVRSKNFTF